MFSTQGCEGPFLIGGRNFRLNSRTSASGNSAWNLAVDGGIDFVERTRIDRVQSCTGAPKVCSSEVVSILLHPKEEGIVEVPNLGDKGLEASTRWRI